VQQRLDVDPRALELGVRVDEEKEILEGGSAFFAQSNPRIELPPGRLVCVFGGFWRVQDFDAGVFNLLGEAGGTGQRPVVRRLRHACCKGHSIVSRLQVRGSTSRWSCRTGRFDGEHLDGRQCVLRIVDCVVAVCGCLRGHDRFLEQGTGHRARVTRRAVDGTAPRRTVRMCVVALGRSLALCGFAPVSAKQGFEEGAGEDEHVPVDKEGLALDHDEHSAGIGSVGKESRVNGQGWSGRYPGWSNRPVGEAAEGWVCGGMR
jgi:hypothetical protein